MAATVTRGRDAFVRKKLSRCWRTCAVTPDRDHGREELADRFWPDADLDAARNSLRVALNSLRRALEPPPAPAGAVLLTTRTHVRLRPETIRTDVDDFEAALRAGKKAAALAIYASGPLLPGLYDEWVLGERERLEALADEREKP